MNHTAFRPSVISQPVRATPKRTSEFGIRLTTILAGLAFTLVLLAALTKVASAQSQPPESAAPAGLFFKSDLTRDVFAAPTLSSEVVIDISGDIARVNIRQRFRNPSDVWMEGVYIFPLPEQSAVDQLVMHIGERRIEGQILEKKAAEKVYREAAEAGRHASLLSSARPNVFSTSLANIGPGEEIVIEIEYQDRVRFDDGAYSYRFPLVVAPRYTPDRPIAFVIVPPSPREGRWPELQPIDVPAGMPAQTRMRDIFGPVRHPDEGTINPVSLAVILDAGIAISDLSAPNHAISITRDGDTGAIIALQAGSIPADQDFVLNWSPANGQNPGVGLFSERADDAVHLVTTVLPPQEVDASIVQKPRDIVLILDKSGSMHGAAIAQAKQAIRLAIARLPADARFNLIAFDNVATPLFNGLRPANEIFITQAFNALDKLDADGGTEMRGALDLAFDSARDHERLMQIVFLTDGAVSNERELFDMIDRRLGDARLFTVGIGPAPNSFFMRRAAEAGRGSFTYIDDPRELDQTVSALLRKLEQPALTDLRVTWNLPGEAIPETYPARIPDLYFGEPITFATRISRFSKDELEGRMRIAGRRGGETWSMEIDLADARDAKGTASLWARSRVADLQAKSGQSESEQNQTRNQVIATALRYQLVTRFTSLVAEDNSVVARPDGAPLTITEMERNLPDGMRMEKVFGAKAFAPGGMTPVRDHALQNTAFRQAIGLPVTATPASRMAIIGAAIIFLALLLLVVFRQRKPGHTA